MSYVIQFESRSDNGPKIVGFFPMRAGAEGHLADLARPGFTAVSEIMQVAPVIESIRAVKRQLHREERS